jgi:flagellar export protein FliJ
MTFRFKLDAVLRFRESVEHTEELALHRLVREIGDVELELHQIDIKQVRLREQRERDLARKLPAVHLMEISERESKLDEMTAALRSRLQQLEIQRINQLAIYQTAHQDRQILSELRDRLRDANQSEQRRQEQKMLDDLFLARSRRLN